MHPVRFLYYILVLSIIDRPSSRSRDNIKIIISCSIIADVFWSHMHRTLLLSEADLYLRSFTTFTSVFTTLVVSTNFSRRNETPELLFFYYHRSFFIVIIFLNRIDTSGLRGGMGFHVGLHIWFSRSTRWLELLDRNSSRILRP